MQQNIKSVVITILFGLMLPALGMATAEDLPPPSVPVVVETTAAIKPVTTDGGLMVGKRTDPYWFQVSGVVKLDQRTFFGDKIKTSWGPSNAGTYNSGATIRDLGVNLDGGVGHDFTYTVELDFDAPHAKVLIDGAYVTYHGLKCLAPNFTFSVGQVFPGFCVSCAASSKWIPFMERSMATNTFSPRQGLGISANTYNNFYSATVAITQQPRVGVQIVDPYGKAINKHDLWQTAGRFTYAPIAEEKQVLQVGFAAHIKEYSNTGLVYTTMPEMRSGDNSVSLLNTTSNPGFNQFLLIAAKNQKTLDFELTGMSGPLSGEAEFQKAYVARGNLYTATGPVRQGNNLSFYGYHAQISYCLTGESRPHKKSNGTLGQIKPEGRYGAWEVSARYSFLTLNNQDVQGGKARNTSASLSWYANNNIRVIAEYVYSLQSRTFTVANPVYLDKRHLSSVGARLQVVF